MCDQHNAQQLYTSTVMVDKEHTCTHPVYAKLYALCMLKLLPKLIYITLYISLI